MKNPLTDKGTSRDFLATLMAVIFGLQLDPERLLWTPGKKLISIPKYVPMGRGNFLMGRGNLLTSDIILDMAMERYERESILMRYADGRWDPSFSQGDEVRIKLPLMARV